MQNTGTSRHEALRKLCSTASSIQLQLGESYQNNQHFRYVLLNACKDESCAHRLATIPTSRVCDVEKSLARAITPEEAMLQIERKKNMNSTSPAYTDDVRFSARPGLPYRRHGSPSSNKSKTVGHRYRSKKQWCMQMEDIL